MSFPRMTGVVNYDPIALDVVGREEWDAMMPFIVDPLMTVPTYVFFALQTHCESCLYSAECKKLIAEMQHEHIVFERLPDIKYNFLIGGDGRVYEGRGWRARPSLPKKYASLEKHSLYIAFIGDLRDPGNTILDKMYEMRNKLIMYGLRTRRIFPKLLCFQLEEQDVFEL